MKMQLGVLAVLLAAGSAWAGTPAVYLEIFVPDGSVRVIGTGGAAALTSYQIDSPAGGLTPATWSSLMSQGYASWDALPATSETVAEVDFDPFGSLPVGAEGVSLGKLFDPVAGHDLVFTYGLDGQSAVTGEVVYVVPEPAGVGTLCLGAIAGLFRRRRVGGWGGGNGG